MQTNKTTTVTGQEIAEGLFEWMKANQWFAELKLEQADMTQEAAAQQAILMLSSGDIATFQRLPLGVKALASYLLLDFFAKVMGPWSMRTWSVDLPANQTANLIKACWLAIAQEIQRTAPPPSTRH